MRFPDGSTAEGSALPAGERTDITLFDRTVPARAIDPLFAEAIRRLVDETLTVFRVEEPESAGGGHRVSLIPSPRSPTSARGEATLSWIRAASGC